MILPRVTETLEIIIVGMLADSRFLSANELHQRIAREYRLYSMRAVYKELAKLLDAGVIIKVQNRFSLNFAWVLEMAQGIDNLYDRYTDEAHFKTFLPEETEKKQWYISDLNKLDNFWINILLILFHANKKRMFQWVPNPWFQLFVRKSELHLQKAMRIGGYKTYSILGTEPQFNDYFAEFLPADIYQFSSAKGPFDRERSRYLHVIGDHIFTINLSEETTEYLHQIHSEEFSSPESIIQKVEEVLGDRLRVKMRLEHNHLKAAHLERKFVEFFGVEE